MSNTTAMDVFVAKKELNTTEVDTLKKKIAGAETKLMEMTSNTTLTDFCTQRQQEKGGKGNGNGELRST